MHHLFVLICLAVSSAVSRCMELHTLSAVSPRCGGVVELPCAAVSSGQLEIKLLSWVAKNMTVCELNEDQPLQDFQCESGDRNLTLIINKVAPVHEGTYLCKLRTTAGVQSSRTAVTVRECVGTESSSLNESHAHCSFAGFYPRAVVHWFQGDSNLTDSADTEQHQKNDGRYDVISSIKKQEDQTRPYRCSLWAPSAGKVLSTQQVNTKERQSNTSGSHIRLQGICVLLHIITLTFIM